MTLLARVTAVPSSANFGYEPTKLSVDLALLTVLDRFERTGGAGLHTMRYFFNSTLLVRWAENAVAETTLESLLNAICDEVDKDPTLGGTCNLAKVDTGDIYYRTIASTKYRACDFIINVKQNGVVSV